MNKYDSFILRQMLFENMTPKLHTNSMKIFGSRALWEAFNMWCFFAICDDENKSKRVTQPVDDSERIEQQWRNEYKLEQAKQKRAEYNAKRELQCMSNRQKLEAFMNYKSDSFLVNLLLLPIQIYCKIVFAFSYAFSNKG